MTQVKKGPVRPKFFPRRYAKNHKASSLEVQVYKLLEEAGVPFVREKEIGRAPVDVFIEPNIVLQIQGCYWHGCPSCFPQLSADRIRQTERDAYRHLVLRNVGYKVHLIWECQVDSNPEAVKQMLSSLVDGSA